jgi:hypothetical protein
MFSDLLTHGVSDQIAVGGSKFALISYRFSVVL